MPKDIDKLSIEKRNQQYAEYVSKISPRSPMWRSILIAFTVGGAICLCGEGLAFLFKFLFPDYKLEYIGALVSSTLILFASILTGFGVYDKFGTFAGAGALVPITGFSNGVTAAAIEHRKEGIVFGTCVNMFKIAGPVIVFGVALSMLVGLVYWVLSLFV